MKRRYFLCIVGLFLLLVCSATGEARARGLAAWHIETVDSGERSGGRVGGESSLAVDSLGRPHISYCGCIGECVYVITSTSSLAADEPIPRVFILRYAFYDGQEWRIETVDQGGCGDTSLALDRADHPHISYQSEHRDPPARELMYAYNDGTGWITTTVDSSGSPGLYSSLVLDSTGRPHVSYEAGDELRYAYYDGMAWQVTAVDNTGTPGFGSLALDTAGYPHISYFDWSHDDLKYAHYDGLKWRIETVDTAGSVGEYTSLALDRAGRPHISYYDDSNNDLRYAFYDGMAWLTQTVDSQGSVGEFTSLALDAQDRPHISYVDESNGRVKYAYLDGGRWQIEAVDYEPHVWVWGTTSLALDRLDRPHVSYLDDGSGDLKYAYRASTAPLPGTGGVVVEPWWWVGAGMLVGVGLALRRWGWQAKRR